MKICCAFVAHSNTWNSRRSQPHPQQQQIDSGGSTSKNLKDNRFNPYPQQRSGVDGVTAVSAVNNSGRHQSETSSKTDGNQVSNLETGKMRNLMG